MGIYSKLHNLILHWNAVYETVDDRRVKKGLPRGWIFRQTLEDKIANSKEDKLYIESFYYCLGRFLKITSDTRINLVDKNGSLTKDMWTVIAWVIDDTPVQFEKVSFILNQRMAPSVYRFNDWINESKYDVNEIYWAVLELRKFLSGLRDYELHQRSLAA